MYPNNVGNVDSFLLGIKPGFCKAQIAKPESGQKLCTLFKK